MPPKPTHSFPKSFLWGCAAASYQIEGAVREDGRGTSIWDTFCNVPGKVWNGDSGSVSCDHYHRWEEDLDMMGDIGIQSYRFSVAWPRVIPNGTGTVNVRGLDFYDRLVDGMLERGIKPLCTLYHWDLPQALEDKGGWRVRETPKAFARYVETVVKRLGDRVQLWNTVNEMTVFCYAGHQLGIHAPGATESPKVVNQVVHHALLAHGLAAQAIRANAKKKPQVGLAHITLIHPPFFETEEHVDAARKRFQEHNAWWLEPLFKGRYPEDQLAKAGKNAPKVSAGEMEIISEPIDFFGQNLYFPTSVMHSGIGPIEHESHFPRTDMGWPIDADAIYWATRFLHELYQPKAIYITENGIAVPDQVNEQGRIDDLTRISFIRNHLRELHRAVKEGIPIKGFYYWSIMDNFEWSFGYSKRFGLVHVNYETQKRTPKASAEWYASVIANHGL